MSFIKRAGLYCFRQWFKTVVLFLVLSLMATSMLLAFAIRDASAAAAADARAAISGKIVLEPDTEGHMGSGGQNKWGSVYVYNGDFITQEIVKAIGEVEGVVDYNSEDAAAYYGAGVDFHYLPAAFGLNYTPYGESSSYTATLSSEKCSGFQSGQYRLAEGRHIMPEDRHVCMISRELADYNKLSVGDKVSMYSLDSDSITEFEIVGIFDGTEGTSGNALTVDEIPANRGYIDYATMFELFEEEQDGYGQLTIYVEDPVNIQNVCNRISALPELAGKTLKLSIDTEEYDVVSAPLASLEQLVNAAIAIISIVSVVVLTLLLVIRIRGRKKEIGILLSVGKSKGNIISQVFAEIFAVAVPAFVVSMPLSNLIAEKAGKFPVSGMADGMTSFTVSVAASYLLPLCLVGSLLIVVSVIASSWTIVRFKPREIFTKQE